MAAYVVWKEWERKLARGWQREKVAAPGQWNLPSSLTSIIAKEGFSESFSARMSSERAEAESRGRVATVGVLDIVREARAARRVASMDSMDEVVVVGEERKKQSSFKVWWGKKLMR